MVNFQPTEEQELIRETMAGFAREVLRPQSREADEKNAVPPAVVERAWELGLVQNSIPEAFGGYGNGRSAIRSALKLEELAYGDLSMSLHLLTPRLFTIPLLVAGTEEQKAHWLPRFTGDRFTAGTAALTEPRWDFDTRALATRAERQGREWVLTGEKCLVPLARDAEAILVYAATPEGLGAFVVEPGTKGLTIGERENNMGVKALDTYGVKLEGVRVPAANRLGGEKGTDTQPLIDAGRVAVAALATGVARAAFDYARDYAKERHAFGMAIARKQAIAFKLADMAIEVDAMRLLGWEAAWKLDRGEAATREAALAKQYASQSALNVADNALQVLGGHGYIRDHLVELFLRNARGLAVFDGLAIV
jgi:alkylation response protein AidB-like acyl-CoA dehydrogenase